MDYSKLTWIELTKICKERKIINASKLKKKGMIEKLIEFDKDPLKTQNETDLEDNIYSKLTWVELKEICTKRKIIYAAHMSKKEMIEKLIQLDKEPLKLINEKETKERGKKA